MTHSGTQRHIGQWIIIDVRQGRGAVSRLGILVTRRFGNAHERNRFKRIVREAYRLSFRQFPETFDVVVKPRTQALQACMTNVQQELRELILRSQNKASPT